MTMYNGKGVARRDKHTDKYHPTLQICSAPQSVLASFALPVQHQTADTQSKQLAGERSEEFSS